MSFKSSMKTSLNKGKAKSLVKYTNASQLQESSCVKHVTKDIGEDTSLIASGEIHAKKCLSSSQAISISPKEHAPIQKESQTLTTSPNPQTPNQVLSPETGLKRKFEDQQQAQIQPAKKSKEADEEENSYN